MNVWVILATLALLLDYSVPQYTPLPRWGQAVLLINEDLYVHGGSTDPTNSFPYTSAPPSSDLLYLSLASSFDPASPPWRQVNSSASTSASPSPALVWHSLSAFRSNGALLFGGRFDPNSPVALPNAPDSAFTLNIDDPVHPVWAAQSPSWANEPNRRIRHSSTSTSSGLVFLIGGERADGSGLGATTNYVFDINAPSFTALTTIDGPPDVSGHVSVVLPDGRLLVLGGFSPSRNELLPLDKVWVLNTTRTPYTWSSVSVVGPQIPPPRRAFAAAVLGNGSVIIHGGCDATYQTSYDDGWLLDTSRSPTTWTLLPMLTRLGARRDHFAIAIANIVIFGFGYGTSSAASTELQVFDGSTAQWAPEYVPPPHTPTSARLPPPGTSSRPTTTGVPSPTNLGSSDLAKSNARAIAICVVLAVLAVALIGLTLCYFRRRRIANRRNQFQPIEPRRRGSRNSFASSQPAAAVMPANDNPAWRRLFSGLGILESNTSRTRRMRKDILADEDTRHFSGPPYYTSDGAASTWSLRSVGAMIGSAIGRRARESSSLSTRSGPRREWSDPFSDNAALMDGQDIIIVGPTSRPYHPRQNSYASTPSRMSYVDPFTDVIVEERREDDSHSNKEENITTGSTNVHPYPPRLPPQQTIPPQTADIHMYHSPLNAANTLSPKNLQSSLTGDSTATGHSLLRVSSPTLTSLPPTQSIRRSDSWWARFSRTPLLDRRPSDNKRLYLDIRDPNPPPMRLGAITEAETPITIAPGGSQASSTLEISLNTSRILRGKSMSSMRTADTAVIERMGGMDVVQRVVTPSPRSTVLSDGRDSPTEDDGTTDWFDRPHASPSDGDDDPLVLSPVTDGTPSPPQEQAIPTSPWRSTGAVASQVLAYERRLSMEQDLANLPLVNTRQVEVKTRKRGQSVNYGLVPRPSLYVANPDTAHGPTPTWDS